jgi:FlaA1/EpsC-like NDP-sugar epimerase
MPTFRNRHFFLMDLVLLPAAAVFAFALRLDAAGMQHYAPHTLLFAALSGPVTLITFRLLGVYQRYWRYASVDELLLISLATAVSAVVTTGLLFAVALPLTGLTGFPRSIPFINGLLTLIVTGGPRYLTRVIAQRNQNGRRNGNGAPEKRVLIAGAGDAGTMIAREMRAHGQPGLTPVGFVDDDRLKVGTQIQGLPVLGTRDQIPALVRDHHVKEVIIAMPAAPGSTVREIVDICNQAGVAARTIPGLYDIISGQVSINQIRQVEIEDLLRRAPVQTDTAAVEGMIRGRRVLVTGAGGSIGSELCRQILRARPAELVLLGRGENSIFRIHNELRGAHQRGPTVIVPVIADVRDRPRLAQVFRTHRPEMVFHAAAHKHVPLMELNVCEAVTNNILGTRNLVEVAQENSVLDLILISTDKAVNPSSIMGATKRVAELIVHNGAHETGRCYAAVRFGNVLGSRGSVVNLFKQQIADGGPVTVTHPEMERYFMTIPEAVQLVLQAAALGDGGEVFVLDMGQPVRIVDLATDLIRLSGLRPHIAGDDSSDGEWDIEVIFTGVRPGEKLSEELFVQGEEYGRTRHDKIFVALKGDQAPLALTVDLDRLIDAARRGDEAQVRALLGAIVPEYRPAAEAGSAAATMPRVVMEAASG